MENQAYDIADEYSADYLHDLTTEKSDELQALILNWLNDNINQPNFFTAKKLSVYNCKRIQRKIFK